MLPFQLVSRSLNQLRSPIPIRQSAMDISSSECCSSSAVVELQPSSSTLEGLDSLRKQEMLCDFVFRLKSENTTRSAHCVVLAASSPYFCALIRSKKRDEPGKTTIELPLPDVSARALDQVLQFAYTGKIDVPLNFLDIQTLLPLADLWRIEKLLQSCCEFLEEKMTPTNCIGIYMFANFYNCSSLVREANDYILWKFPECAASSLEYLKLEPQTLIQFLSHDKLNLSKEDNIWECISQWVLASPKERSFHLVDMLQCIRFGVARPQLLEKISSDELLVNNPPALEFLQKVEEKVSKHQSLLRQRSAEDKDCMYLFRHRVPHDIAFAIGGWSLGHPTSAIETYDSKAEQWCLCLSTDNTPRAYHGVAELKGKIYIIGGYDGTEYFNGVRCFNPVNHIWYDVAPMYMARCYVSVAILDGKLYAIGGFNGRDRLQSVECYDPVTNQWTHVRPMQRIRSDACAAVLNGKIYVGGGFDGQNVLRDVECYDPLSDTWTDVAPMQCARSGVSMVEVKGQLYVFGGFDGFTRLCTAEKYRPETNQWQWLPDMSQCRSNFATMVIQDLIYIIGGFNGITTVASIERYDPSSNSWETMSDMLINRSALKACVVYRLPNVRDYSSSRIR